MRNDRRGEKERGIKRHQEGREREGERERGRKEGRKEKEDGGPMTQNEIEK